MDLIATLLNRDQSEIRPSDPDSPEMLGCWQAYFDELLARVPAARPEMFALPDQHADLYRSPRGLCLVAWSDDLPIGCVALRPIDASTGEVKRLWVHGSARGQGLARRLMTAIETEARAMGLTHLKLDTNSALSEALALYRATGWRESAPYTGAPADVWLEKPL